jgi:phenylacetate-CoA ligase
VLVTALQNLAMPLIRYDTGDIAMAVEGACPCGRTLPSFGEIAGRYRRYAGLPEGTRKRVNVLQETIKAMPPEIVRNSRYQVIRFEDRFEVW